MAQDLRSRAAVAGALLLAACGQEPPPGAPPTPRAVDTAGIAAERLVAAVLEECHPSLTGMARVAATVRLADGSDVQLFAELPDTMRVQSARGRFLLRDGAVLRLDDKAPAATPAEQKLVLQLRTLLDAAAFGPLHRATGCRRLGPSAFELAGAPPVGLTLRAGTLLPASFQIAGETVAVLDYLRTATTWVAKELEVPGLGRCHVRFDFQHIDWAADFFQPPAKASQPAAAPPQGPRLAPASSGEVRSPTPIELPASAMRWAIVPDPGDWQARAAAYRPLHDELVRQDQAIAGFPLFFAENGKRWLAAPFRQRPEGAAFVAPRDWTLRDVPDGKWLVVYPPDGDLARRVADGERMLADALRNRRITGNGPITSQPFFHLEEGEPPASKLEAPVVRVAVRID